MSAVWSELTRRSSPDLFRLVGELDASFSQVKMLFLLEEGGERAVKDLAAALGLSLPAVSRAVDGLARKGFVTRRECANDRRSKLVTLAPKGRAAVQRALRARMVTLEGFLAEVPEADRAALAAALAPIVERMASP